jgi:putative transposase
MKSYRKSTGSIFRLNYHIVLVVKYRKKIFVNNKIIERVKQILEDISLSYDIIIINQDSSLDHIHLLIDATPKINLSNYINMIKGISSRILRKEFGKELKDKLWGKSLWSSSYFITTVGNTSVEIVNNYIKNQ